MWVLLSTRNNTADREKYIYFVGVFDNKNLANEKRMDMIKFYDARSCDYFVKRVEMNIAYS